jgi:hypothetical protein
MTRIEIADVRRACVPSARRQPAREPTTLLDAICRGDQNEARSTMKVLMLVPAEVIK